MTNENPFVMRDYDIYELGIRSAMGPTIFDSYDVLRRNIWRDLTSGDQKLRRMWKDGLLASKIKQSTIADRVGIGRQQLNKLIADMRRLGWLRVEALREGQTYAYVLGETCDTEEGRQENYSSGAG